MAKNSTLPGAAKPEKPKKPEADEIDEEEEDEEVETKKAVKKPTVDLSHYPVPTRKKARELIAAGKDINGTEEIDLINTLWEELQQEEREEVSEQEEIDGVPNNLAVRTETLSQNGKDVRFPIFFVAAVKGGQALYNERGQRVSPVCTPTSDPNQGYINKAAARYNAERRRHRLPGDAA